jgi:PAS domain S-box-containing protein
MIRPVTSPVRSALVLVAANPAANLAERADAVRHCGHRALEACDGVDAFAVATRHLPDVVVADLALPKIDGVELTARLQANADTRDIPTILIRDPASRIDDSSGIRGVIVSSVEEMIRELNRVVADPAADTESMLPLRRALVDVREAAKRCGDETLARAERARQMATSAGETMISILIADDEARYVDVSPAVCPLSGYSRDELLRMTIWDLTGEERTPQGKRLWRRFLKDGRFEGPYRIQRKTGEIVTIRCAAEAHVAPGLHVSALAPPRLLSAIKK